MFARELIGKGVPEGHEIVMDASPPGIVGVVYVGKRGGVNVIRNDCKTQSVPKTTQFYYQQVIPATRGI